MTLTEQWLHSRKTASLDGIALQPLRHPVLRHAPLSISRGQAMAYFLTDDQHRGWILKKFLPGKDPEIAYIRAIRTLVPVLPGFESGSQRRVLSKASVAKGGFHSAELIDWIENTILMPRVSGADWLSFADSIRSGSDPVTVEQRTAMCISLIRQVQALEANGLSHRDLSVTNVFIDPATWQVQFIDWDGLYHASLAMPGNTTIGTNGYTSPIVMTSLGEDAKQTWCPHADRFAMAVLCAEFLLMAPGSVLANDGGLFEQSELHARGGPGLLARLSELGSRAPHVARLVQRALWATSFDACPSPAEWLACPTFTAPIDAPRLRDVESFMTRFNSYIQSLQQPKSPQRPAPQLAGLSTPDLTPIRRAARAAPPRPAPSLRDADDPGDPQKSP